MYVSLKFICSCYVREAWCFGRKSKLFLERSHHVYINTLYIYSSTLFQINILRMLLLDWPQCYKDILFVLLCFPTHTHIYTVLIHQFTWSDKGQTGLNYSTLTWWINNSNSHFHWPGNYRIPQAGVFSHNNIHFP